MVTGAGNGIGASDEDNRAAGADIAPNAEEVFGRSTMIVKVKEPQRQEWARLGAHHILFTYQHLAADRDQRGYWPPAAPRWPMRPCRTAPVACRFSHR